MADLDLRFTVFFALTVQEEIKALLSTNVKNKS
jgi:hypothetical protein